jgi:hypothetical protein
MIAVQEELGDARVERQETGLPALQRERVGDHGQAQGVGVRLERRDELPQERDQHEERVADQQRVGDRPADLPTAVAGRPDGGRRARGDDRLGRGTVGSAGPVIAVPGTGASASP